MKCLAVVAALAVVPGLATAEESSAPTAGERFDLWNECRPVGLRVFIDDEAGEIGLTKERIETTARSRLRAARIYDDDPYLDITMDVEVNVFQSTFTESVSLNKLVRDFVSGELKHADTWDTGALGTHGQDARFILQGVSEHVDQFIDEYLRVNADAC